MYLIDTASLKLGHLVRKKAFEGIILKTCSKGRLVWRKRDTYKDTFLLQWQDHYGELVVFCY